MNIKVNGIVEKIDNKINILAYLKTKKIKHSEIVIELNKKIIPKEAYNKTLKDGDELEILSFVGGG